MSTTKRLILATCCAFAVGAVALGIVLRFMGKTQAGWGYILAPLWVPAAIAFIIDVVSGSSRHSL